MKTNRSVVAALTIALACISFSSARAQSSDDPGDIVKSLYAVHNSGAPLFNQTSNRAIVDKYFEEELANLIWKDAVAAKGELGALGFDPLLGVQDAQIKDFKILPTEWEEDKRGRTSGALVPVTYRDGAKKHTVSFSFQRYDDASPWKISEIDYTNGDSLKGALSAASAKSKAPAGKQAETGEAFGACSTDAYVVDKDPDGLNVRSFPRTGNVIGNIPLDSEGTTVHLVGQNADGGWVQIDEARTTADQVVFSKRGWVSGNMLAVSTRGYDTKGVKLYEINDENSKVVATIPPDTEVKVLGCDGGMLLVKYKNSQGWLAPESQCPNPVTNCN